MSTIGIGNPRYLDLLSHLSQIVSSSKSLDTILYATVSLIKTMLDVERCSILILDSREKVLRMKAASNIAPEEWEKIQVPLGQGISGRVAQDGRALLVENSMDSAELSDLMTPERYATHSFICVPLKIKSSPMGVICVNNKSDSMRFNNEHLELMIALAGFLSLTIENARLFRTSENIRTHLENIVDSLPAAVLTINLRQRITSCNSRLARLLAFKSDEEIEQRKLTEVMPEALLKVLTALINETVEFRVESQNEIEFESPLFGTMPLEVATSPLTDVKGRVDGVLITLTDVSMRREVAELRRLDEMKSNFMSMVSHELRTPLTSIKGSIHLLMNAMGAGLSTQQAELVHIVHNNTERLMRLVNDLLDVVHIENKTLSIIKRPDNLRTVLEQCLHLHEAMAKRKNLEVTADLDDVNCMFDRDRIRQAVCNLLDNAFKFTSPGGVVAVSLREEAGMARVAVRDSGPGIAEPMRGLIFTKFFQTEDTMTRTACGTGIGLYIAKNIAELHNGVLRLGECNAQGSEFVMELPLSPAIESETGPAGAAEKSTLRL